MDVRTRPNSSDTTTILGVAAAGIAAGLAINPTRKLLVQAVSGVSGDWFDALRTEHRLATLLLEKMEQSRPDQRVKRNMLLLQLKHALGKHAFQEEMVIYPALRDHAQKDEADKLNHEHGYVKDFLYELDRIEKDDPRWVTTVREFRDLLDEHVRDEEEKIFPPFRARLSPDESRRLTLMMHKEGLKFA